MSYCRKCGTKLEEGTTFCPNCGAQTNKSSNESSTNIPNEDTSSSSEPPQFNFNEIIDVFKSTILKPVSGGKHFVASADKNLAIIITIIFTILQGLLSIWRTSELLGKVSSGASSLLDRIPLLSSFIGSTIDSVSIPYLKIFIQECVLYLIFVGILFGLLCLVINNFSKIKHTSFMVFKTVLISTLPYLVCEFISIILSTFALPLGIIFILLGVLISIVTLTVIISEGFKVKGDICAFLIPICLVVTVIIYLVILTSCIASNSSYIGNSLFR
ncbi:MAG: zinc ribbon domain-containing protein [Clostridium sp.]|nr:zinc ribbon domain-containing protein [Clostridium sp.]